MISIRLLLSLSAPCRNGEESQTLYNKIFRYITRNALSFFFFLHHSATLDIQAEFSVLGNGLSSYTSEGSLDPIPANHQSTRVALSSNIRDYPLLLWVLFSGCTRLQLPQQFS